MREYFKTPARYLELDITFPYQEMLQEAINIKDKFISYRENNSMGWKSLVLHGSGTGKPQAWKNLGYKSAQEASDAQVWTDESELCPITTNYFKTQFPCNRYGRLRYMLVEAGGHIDFHVDSRVSMVDNISFVLNYPNGCEWKWGDSDETIPFTPGKAYALNISYPHGIWNNSDEDRYFVIAARHDSLDDWKELMTRSAIKQNIEGEFITLDTLP